MKNIYKSKVAKAYHRYNLVYKIGFLFFIILLLIAVLIVVSILVGLEANENIICVSVLSIAILIAIILGLYNDSYTETELSDFHSFVRKYFTKQNKRKYKRRERKYKKWLI